jgi:phosphatidylserine/phosphatidylglycerophosphate/cardiolipin synthase-like enzyme
MTEALQNSSLTFLEDGKQPPQQVAERLASFLRGAQQSLDIAIYDSGLIGDLADVVGSAIVESQARGVSIRVAYHAETERTKGIPAPSSQTALFVESLHVPCRPAGTRQNLMHHKYVIRDGGSGNAAIWTGSTNWGADAWAREENVILELYSPQLAGHYSTDFDEIWSGPIENSGGGAGGAGALAYEGQPVRGDVWFSPAEGPAMADAAGKTMVRASRRVVIASPVLTSGSILNALSELVDQGQVPVRGIVDRTQMEEVREQWGENDASAWKLSAFESLARRVGLVGKRSTPWSPAAVHDYMHLKMIVVDDAVFTGSFNFSHSGEDNAENLLRLDSPSLADDCAAFIDQLIARYAGTPAVDPA